MLGVGAGRGADLFMKLEDRNTTAVPPLSTAAIAALHRGNKIEAIKITREERHIELKEAKDAVEEHMRSQPSLESSFAAAQTETKRSVLLWLVALIALALVAYYFLIKP